MGYSKNSRAVQRVKLHLEEMQVVNGVRKITWVSLDASKLAYYIREACSFPEFAPLKAKYIITVAGNYVTAMPRVLEPLANEHISEQLGTMTLSEVSDTLEVIGAAMLHKVQVMFFPNADVDMEKLYSWTNKNGYFLVLSDEGLTVTKQNPGELAWSPENA